MVLIFIVSFSTSLNVIARVVVFYTVY